MGTLEKLLDEIQRNQQANEEEARRWYSQPPLVTNQGYRYPQQPMQPAPVLEPVPEEIPEPVNVVEETPVLPPPETPPPAATPKPRWVKKSNPFSDRGSF